MILDVFVNLIHVLSTLDSIVTGRFVEENAVKYIIGSSVSHDPSGVSVDIVEDCCFIASGINCSNISDGRDIFSAKQFRQFSHKIRIVYGVVASAIIWINDDNKLKKRIVVGPDLRRILRICTHYTKDPMPLRWGKCREAQ